MNEPQDNRVEVELDLEPELLFELMIMAHQKDITLNSMVELILKELIVSKQHEQKN